MFINITLWVESILNPRPLTPISDDVNDLKALTPSHFIIGSYENTVPGVFHKQEIDYLQKWRSVQAAVDMFWIRWKKEYLPSLNLRKRWTQTNRNFRVGDLVIISSHGVPRSYWPRGRIIEVYPGRGGFVLFVPLNWKQVMVNYLDPVRCCAYLKQQINQIHFSFRSGEFVMSKHNNFQQNMLA